MTGSIASNFDKEARSRGLLHSPEAATTQALHDREGEASEIRPFDGEKLNELFRLAIGEAPWSGKGAGFIGEEVRLPDGEVATKTPSLRFFEGEAEDVFVEDV
jgi:hypothetical protein